MIFTGCVAKNPAAACMPAGFSDDSTTPRALSATPSPRASDTTMAKSSRSTDSSSTTWLTAAEQRVLDATVGSPLATATRNQLLAAIKQARSLRDKWRDLFTRQSIASKSTQNITILSAPMICYAPIA